MALRINARRKHRTLSVTINAILSPAKAGFLVWLWWKSPTGDWMQLEARTTNTAGKATWLYSFTSYPQTVRVHLPAGQVIDGVKYGGLTSEPISLWDTQEGDFYLFPPEVEDTIFIIGYVWDYVNERYLRPKFRFDGKVVEGSPGEVFARLDDYPGSYQIEMINEGYDFYEWGVWPEYPTNPTFANRYANPTTIQATHNCYYYCLVYPTPLEGKGSIVSYNAPSSAIPGDTVTVTAEAKNIGAGTATFRLRLVDRDLNVEVDASSWFTIAPGYKTTKSLSGIMPDKNWNLRLDLERLLTTGATVVDDKKTFTAINIINWWDSIRAWWNDLAGWQKGIILTISVGGVIIGGASTLKKS